MNDNGTSIVAVLVPLLENGYNNTSPTMRNYTMPAYNTDEMLLIYRSETGELYHQSWRDLVESGTLIDPESGEDMECVGWCLPNDA